MPVEAPAVTQLAVLLNGFATCIFLAKPYKRLIVLVDMKNTVPGAVTIYRGTPSGAFSRVISNPQGSNQQWTKAFSVAGGQGLFVQWASAPSPVSNAVATITWLEEETESKIRDRRLWER
jgi:hypothetical protein